MEIIVAKSAGFCFGVQRAIEMLYKAMDEHKGNIYTIGPIIHNPQMIEQITSQGVQIINDIDLLPNDAIAVIRAHGLPKADYEKLRMKTDNIIDTTCPFVAKIHRIVEKASAQGHFVFIGGDEKHPEVIGIRGYSNPERCFVFKDADDFVKLTKKLAHCSEDFVDVVWQTTYSTKEFEKCKKIIKKVFKNSILYDTICNATELRQEESAELAAKCDAFFVVGGKESSNTNKLYSISSAVCSNTFLIESASEIPIKTIKEFKTIGVTAGASTPDCVIEEVKLRMSEETKNVTEISEMSFAEMLENSCKTITTGERVKVVVVGVGPTEIKVELGAKQSGFITKDNFSADPAVDLENAVKIGDEFDAIVLRVSDVEGTIALSKKKLDALAGFEKIETAMNNKDVVEGVVTGVNNGGLTVTVFGVRVFVPMSQTGKARDFDFNTLLNTEVKLNIIEFSNIRGRKKIIGSMKALANAERKQAQEAFWAAAEVGQKLTGFVRSERSITNFGVFVDIGGVDGLVHITELSWKKIKHPSEVVKVGDELEVYIKELDAENKKVSLGYKKDEDNPFKLFTDKFNVDDVTTVKIVSLMPFGAFANIVDGVDGLIHISQLSDKRIAKPADVVKVGDEVEVKIVEIDTEKQKVGLSMRALIEQDVENVEVETEVVADEAAVEA